MAPTKLRILDSAERLFAERGYASTSVRDVVADADANQAAIHYHFHSKEALLDAVVARRCVGLNRARF
jgi:AcrR family transcriptional regulator